MFLFLCLLAVLTHSVVFPIGFYPNQIWYGTLLSVFGIVLVYAVFNRPRFRGAFSSGLPIYLYFLLLLLSACWAEFPEYTLNQLRFDWIFIVIFWLFYCLVINLGYDNLRIFFIIFPLPYFAFLLLYYIVLGERSSRLGDPLQVAIAIPFVCVSLATGKNRLLAGLSLMFALIIMSISMKKMIIISGMFGLIASTWVIYPFLRNTGRFFRSFIFVSIVSAIALIISLEIPDTREYVLQSVSRFGYDASYGHTYFEAEPEDLLRKRIEKDSVELLKENWLAGIGYMNFEAWSVPYYGRREVTFTGQNEGTELFGQNLHNSFMTWALEGGVICVVIVGFIIVQYYSIILRILKTSRDDGECLFAKAAAVAMLQLLAFGLFHQVHAAPQFWLMIGVVYAMNRSQLSAHQRPSLL